jgi:hypothetical protein
MHRSSCISQSGGNRGRSKIRSKGMAPTAEYPEKYFLDRTHDLERGIAEGLQDVIRDDFASLILELALYVDRHVPVAELEARAAAQAAVDVDTLDRAVRQVRDVPLDQDILDRFAQYEGGNPATWGQRLDESMGQLRERGSAMSDFERAVVLDMLLDKAFLNFLIAAKGADPIEDDLESEVQRKLRLVPDDVLATAWQLVQTEFSESRVVHFPRDAEILPSDFFKPRDTTEMRARIARYLVRYRPELIRRRIRTGEQSFPWEAPSIVRILGLMDSQAAEELSVRDLQLLRSLARVGVLWQRTLQQSVQRYFSAIGVSAKGRIAAGPDAQDLIQKLDSAKNVKQLHLLVLEISTLIRLLGAIVTYERPIELPLRQYKLGIELFAPANHGEYDKRGELELQKELCRYLIDAGIFSVGTKFGPSEVDLLAETREELFVIECKKFNRRPSENQLQSAFVQLSSYMDQAPTFRRGVLVIYNLSDTLIQAPRTWLWDRYWVVAINIMEQSPSKRENSIRIDEGTDGRAELLIMGQPRRSRKKGTARTAAVHPATQPPLRKPVRGKRP